MTVPTMQMTYNGGAAAFADVLRAKLSEVVKKTARDYQATAINEIQSGEKSGRIYMHGNVAHQASAPDESPATDTGNLIGSISIEDKSDLESTVIVGAEYGLYLEVGTVHMEPRPFMSPALAQVEAPFIAACEKAIATS